MSTQEVRTSTKWNAIRSRAVPSNVMTPRPDSALTVSAMLASQMDMDKPDKIEKTGKASKAKAVLPAKLHKRATFAGSTGSSRV